MNTRIDELLRQRELMRDHLRWLEKEIASEHGATSEPATETNIQVHAGSESSFVETQSGNPAAAAETAEPLESLGALLEPDVTSLRNEVRSGCFIYAAILFGGLALLVGFVYWMY